MTIEFAQRRESPSSAPGVRRTEPRPGDIDLATVVRGIVSRHPAIGFGLGVVRDGHLAAFEAHGLADVRTRIPVTSHTVFRIGSVTKLVTAVAIMQLHEQGLINPDAPANDYLRAYRLVPSDGRFRPATVRHLLTHTAGIPEVVHLGDLFHPDWGPFGSRPAELSVPFGKQLPSRAEYYAGRLRVTADPGSTFQYTNHGFNTLGQIVEDVSGMPLATYYRGRIFEPLGMGDTDLVRSDRIAARLATGYELGRSGSKAVPDREWMCAGGAGGIYSTLDDLARFAAAMLGGGANEQGRVLQRSSLASMFEDHYRPDPRLPGRGLGFERSVIGGHRVVGHDGLLPGFDTALLVAPDDGIGIVAFTNGSSGAHTWLGIELTDLLRRLLGVSPDSADREFPEHPETWGELCGRYQLPAGSDLRGRLALGGGAEVFVRGGRLMARVLTPVPVLLRGFPLQANDTNDPFLLRLDLSSVGMPNVQVAFARGTDGSVAAAHVDLPGQPLTLRRAPTNGIRPIQVLAFAGMLTAASIAMTAGRRHTRAS